MIIHNPYKDDFRHTPEVDGKGKFKDKFYYDGEFYSLSCSKKEKGLYAVVCFLFIAAVITVICLQGMLNSPSSRTVWVVLPYFIQFLTAGYFILGLIDYVLLKMSSESKSLRMSRPQFDGSIARMKHSMIGQIVVAALVIICDVVFIVKNRNIEGISREFVFLGLGVVIIAIAMGFGLFYNKNFSKVVLEK